MTCHPCRFLVFATLVLSGGVLGYITQPLIRDLSNGHTKFGEDLKLECTFYSSTPDVKVKWKAPLIFDTKQDQKNNGCKTENITQSFYKTRCLYIVTEANRKDKALYYCEVAEKQYPNDTKYNRIFVQIYDSTEQVIEFDQNHSFFDKSAFEVIVYVRAHPEPNVSWTGKDNKFISPNSTKYILETSPSNRLHNYKLSLRFHQVDEADFGNYTVLVNNGKERKKFVTPVNMTGTPTLKTTVDQEDEDSLLVKSQSSAFPKPDGVKWQFQKCWDLSCFQSNTTSDEWQDMEAKSEESGLQVLSSLSVNKTTNGLLRATSSNQRGTNSSLTYIYSPPKIFELFSSKMIVHQSIKVIESLFNENLEIFCAISYDVYFPEIRWFKSGRKLALDNFKIPARGYDEYTIKMYNATFSIVSKLTVNIDKEDNGEYYCKAFRRNGTLESRAVKVLTREQPTLNVVSNMENKTMRIKFGEEFKFFCNVDGYPTPKIIWYKNNDTVVPSPRIVIRDNNQTLAMSNIDPKDNGTYSCKVTNRLNQTVVKRAILEATPNEFDWLLVVIIVLVVILVTVVLIITVKIRKDYRLKRELKAAGLENFEKGAIEYINPDRRPEEQAKYLPYDKKWEIPTESLTLGKQLGSGAFGVVVKAEFEAFDSKEKRPVAVKMVNKFADHDCINALASELKIMVHLGHHVNIVNLIGACTKDVLQKKLLVVVEYCPFGNLHEYILLNSYNFVDQRNKEEDKFDWPKNSVFLELKNATIVEENTSGMNTDTSEQDASKETIKLVETLSSQTLLIWAFQICNGMDYLAFRKILHGDLAARNILLSDNNVVKISDFGLSKNMYKTGIYQKKAKGLMPVKWMAVESIGENIFSTQSDVWSFGVVLWEFFSLAKTPFPGMIIDQNFYKKLLCGYRMEKPNYATTEIYNIMVDCWNAAPMMRPSFNTLASKIGSILEKCVANYYLDMNGPYVKMTPPQEDYLSKMSAPDFINFVTPTADFINNITYFHQNKSVGYVNWGQDISTSNE